MIPFIFDMYLEVTQKVLQLPIQIVLELLIMISMLSFSECITCSSSLSLEEVKLIAIVNWILHEPDF